MKNEKGITILSLAITIILLAILGFTITVNSDVLKEQTIQNNFEIDITQLSTEIEHYYMDKKQLPILNKYTNTSMLDSIKNPNDGPDYYIIDIRKLDVNLKYGNDFENVLQRDISLEISDLLDVYIVNSQSHTVYYPKGIEYKGTTYYKLADNYTDISINIVVNAQKYLGKYDGNPHTATIETQIEGVTIKYGTKEGTYDLTEIPTYTEVGAYTIYYQATKEGYEEVTGSVQVEIQQLDTSNFIITLPYNSIEYTGSPITPEVTVKYEDRTLILNTDYTVSYSNNTNVGTATVTVTGIGNFAGTKTANFTIQKPTLVSQIKPANYGNSVAYSVTVNGVTLDNWKIFYNDGKNVIIMYNGYLPNSTNIAKNAELATDGTYGVYSDTNRKDLIDKLNNTSKWTSLIRSDLAGKATAKGAVDIETWLASWNEKEYTKLYIAKKTGMSDSIGWGYYIGTGSNPTNTEAFVGTTNKLYFPYQTAKSDCWGYWIASPSARDALTVMDVDFNGNVGRYDYNGYTHLGVCPVVYLSSDVRTSGQDASGAWMIE